MYQVMYTRPGSRSIPVGPKFNQRYDANIYVVGRAQDTGSPISSYTVIDATNVPESTLSVDEVDNPSHYARLTPQPVEVVAAWKLDFFDGSVLAYIARAGFKGDKLLDYKKAASFLSRKIALLEGKSVLDVG